MKYLHLTEATALWYCFLGAFAIMGSATSLGLYTFGITKNKNVQPTN